MASDEKPPVEKQPLQFSILSLLVLTTIVAIGLSLIVVIGGWIGVSSLEAAGLLLWRVVFYVPVGGVWLVAAIIAVRRWNRHPRVSKLVLSAAIGYAVVLIARFLGDLWFQHLYMAPNSSTDYWMVFSIARGVLHSFGSAACLALLVIAAFRWRIPPE